MPSPYLAGRFSEDHIVERFKETRVFPQAAPGDAHYEGIDLGQYLKEGKHGVFMLHLAAFDPAKKPASDDAGDDSDNDDSSVSDDRLIVVTDLGMLAKRALDGSRDVFVQSIRTGEPVGGASVSVMAINGETLFTETTAADGVVHFPSLKGLSHEKKPVMYMVKKGDDLSFLPTSGEDRKLDYSRFDIGGETNPTSEGELSAYLFSDRGIYRPGDHFHIGIIVRTANWARSPAGIPLQAEIVDPRGITVKRQPVGVDASGFTELSYTPAETAPTGTWSVNLYIVGKDNEETAIGSTTVSVKEFLPDSMKVDATLSAHIADGWVKPDKLKGIVDVHNLFGTPAADRRVEASLTLNPTFPAFHNWADYQFYDLRHAKDGYTTQLQDGRTNDQGHAEFDLDLKKYADATYRLDFLAKAYEAEGGRNVAATRRDARLQQSLARRLQGGRRSLLHPARQPPRRASRRHRSGDEIDRAERPRSATDRAALRFRADQAGFRRLQIRIAAEGSAHQHQSAHDPGRRSRLHTADRQARRLCARDPLGQCRREPDRIFGDG